MNTDGFDEKSSIRSGSESTTYAEALEGLTRAVRRQTTAIWMLAVLLALAFAAPWIVYLARSHRYRPTETFSRVPSREPSLSRQEPDNDFFARPIEEKINRAAAILITETKQQGNRHIQMITKIVKVAPGARLYYKQGEEFTELGHAESPDCSADCEGDGEVVFLTGNPPMMTESTSYRGGRIEGMGGMTLTDFEKLAGSSR